MNEVAVPQCCVNTGIVAIVDKSDIISEAVELAYLIDCQCSTRTGNNILDSALRHAYNVGLSLNEDHAVGLADSLLCLVQSEEFVALVVNLGVG